MSLAIAPTMSAAIAACACGTCAACAPRRVAAAAPEPVAEASGNRPREDRFDASGAAPSDAAGDDRSAEEEPADDTKPTTQELTLDERRVVSELQLRDREVRAHEAAHKSAGGAYVGGASYTYQQGPDGRQYAIGGEVPVDLSTGGDNPEAVIAKMEQVRAAALAPGDPSPQDHAVAAAADAIAAQARRDLQTAEEKEDEENGNRQAERSSDPTLAGADAADDPATNAFAVPTVEGSGPLNGRAMQAYRQAQEAAFTQGLINQRA